MAGKVSGQRQYGRVLVVIVARIGDTVLVTPALRALREISDHLTVLAHPKRSEVLRNLPFIDELGGITKKTAWFNRFLRRAGFDLAVCYGRDADLLRYCLHAADRVVCFDHAEFRNIGNGTLLRVPPPPESSLHAVRERLLLAEAAGARTDDLRLSYAVSATERAAARDWIARNLPRARTPLVGLQPFSFPTKAHRDWPLENFVDLSARIIEACPDGHILIFGDEDAAKKSSVFERRLPGRCTVAAGKRSLRESAALFEALSLYIGVDTGPTHIVGALSVPMIALYHPAYPGDKLCPLGHPRCIVIEPARPETGAPAGAEMATITTGRVWDSVRDLLAGIT